MPITVRLDDDVVASFKEHGQFGESYSDALRRLLPGFKRSVRPQVSGNEKRVEAGARNAYPLLFGHAVTSIIRALGALGWSEDDIVKALRNQGIEPHPATVRTQHGWGRQWGINNPHCYDSKKPYGTKPPALTPEQLAELQREVSHRGK